MSCSLVNRPEHFLKFSLVWMPKSASWQPEDSIRTASLRLCYSRSVATGAGAGAGMTRIPASSVLKLS